MMAAVVYAFDSYPITDIIPAILWLMLLALLSFLMVSTWRYWSFKDLNLLRPRTPLILVVMGGVIYGIWNWSQPVLLILASIYVGSGIAIRLGGIMRRHFRHTPGRIRRLRLAETIALVGGETLLGREVRDVLGETALGQQLRLVPAAEEETGTLTEIGGSRHFSPSWIRMRWKMRGVVILAGTLESSKAALEANPAGAHHRSDVRGGGQDPAARIRAPQVEGADYEIDHTGPQIVAHPAATAIAMVLRRLNANYPIARMRRAHFPAGQRVRDGGHRRAAAADGQSAFLSAGAEKGFRHAAGFRDAGAIGFRSGRFP